MRVSRFEVTSIFVSLLLIIPMSGINIKTHQQNLGQSFSPSSDIQFIQVIPDTGFDNTPEVYIAGTSEEFTWSHEYDMNEEDRFIELTWNHQPDTELSWSEYTENMPSCGDFIYFTQTSEWNYEQLPIDVFGSLEYGIITSGDFANSEVADSMFEIYWWLIDSSGNWRKIYNSTPMTSNSFSIEIDLNYFDIAEGWRGMVENENGEQEDPEDFLTVAFGFAPTDYFRSYYSSEPWRTYSGNVSIRFYSASLAALMRFQDDPSEILHSTLNNSYNSPASEIFQPTYQVEDRQIWDYMESMHLGEDNSIYTIGSTQFLDESLRYSSQVLVKWNSQTTLEWAKRYGNQTAGYSLTVDGNSIYTAGHTIGGTFTEGYDPDILILKYNSLGGILWEQSYDSGYRDWYPQIAHSPDGSIIVGFQSNNGSYSTSNFSSNLVLVKLDSDGTIVSSTTIPGLAVDDLEIDPDGNIFVLSYHPMQSYLYKYDSEFIFLFNSSVWNLEGTLTDIEIDSNGNLYTASNERFGNRGYQNTTFRKWTSLNSPAWNITYAAHYGYGVHDQVNCPDFEIAPDLSLFALMHLPMLGSKLILVKINSDGIMEWNRTIGDNTWPEPSYWPIPIEVGTNGFLYISYSKISANTGISFAVDAFQYEATPSNEWSLLSLISLSVTIGSSAVIVAVLILTIRDRRKNGSSL